jgi:hypothetical protein
MSDILKQTDPGLVALEGKNGAILVSPKLQGRIFCTLGAELVHRLDEPLLKNPVPHVFNNLGGNSLWPAPEGGDFAFNYLPGSPSWVVQDGIAKDPAFVTNQNSSSVRIEKNIHLMNRKGVSIRLLFKRDIGLLEPNDLPAGTTFRINRIPHGLKSVAYRSEDILEPLGRCREEDVLIAPWSLEQFQGGDGVMAFVKVRRPENAINFDFYGMPEQQPVYGKDFITLPLGGKNKFQIGVKVDSEPELLGAFDRARSLLFLRQTGWMAGRYFNIADNDQPAGPDSAADMYSVFNGGELNFFELETIAPMQVSNHSAAASRLLSKTWIYSGTTEELEQFMTQNLGIPV